MTHAMTLTPIAALLALTACGASTVSVEDIDLRPPDTALAEPCREARALGGEPMTQAEVERAWIADRAALRDCRARHGLAVEWIEWVVRAVRGASRSSSL